MSDIEDDFRATAESLAADAERLRTIEREKSTLELDDPRLETLAAESSEIAERVRVKSLLEEELVHEVVTSRREDEPSDPR
jgi:hypothetical protein